MHVTFGESAAGSLMRALGRQRGVVPISDNLAIGPINPGAATSRLRWHHDYMRDELWTTQRLRSPWRRIATSTRIVAWLSTRCASEYCGFLELVWRIRDIPISVIDIAPLGFARFGFVRHDVIVAQRLLDHAVPMTRRMQAKWLAEWRTLRTENASLRVLTPRGLRSVPINHLDSAIVGCVPATWRTAASIIGDLLGAEHYGLRQGADLHFLLSRLTHLVDTHAIVGQVDPAEPWLFRALSVRR
jgi:Protein of unknown function/Domain of unknown function (DUF1835)